MEAVLASEFVTIGELVRLTGARYSTLKFYTEEGLLPFEQAEERLTRRYPRAASVARIEAIVARRRKDHPGDSQPARNVKECEKIECE